MSGHTKSHSLDSTSDHSGGKVLITPEGGVAIKLTNKTGANSVKGTIVVADPDVDNAFEIAPADTQSPIGVVYEAGVADGSDAWVVVYGIAEVLLKDSTTSTRGYWAKVSDTNGRADITTSNPPVATAAEHSKEIGHGLESKSGGTDVLTKIAMHFN